MTEFEQQVIAELVRIRLAVESLAGTEQDSWSEILAEPSPRTIDEWYDGVLARSIALEAVGDDE